MVQSRPLFSTIASLKSKRYAKGRIDIVLIFGP
jgi:hypothetical protein